MKPWTIDQLKTELSSRKELKGWTVMRENVRRRERYFLASGKFVEVDQDREAKIQNISLKVFVCLPSAERQGEMTLRLVERLPLKEQVDSAIRSAMQTDHEAWDLPAAPPAAVAAVQGADPKIEEDLDGVVERLSSQVVEHGAKQRASAFNSAELFVSTHHREAHWSNGLVHRSGQTRIYAEAAFSHSRKKATGEIVSDEYMNTAWSVGLEGVSIPSLFDETSERAALMLDTRLPETGKYSVIVDAEVLSVLLNGHLAHLTGLHAYQRLPFVAPGQDLIPGATGDLLSLTLDPFVPLGADTVALSDQAALQAPLKLVVENKVLATAMDQQYATYLKKDPSTVRGDVVVGPGTSSLDELRKAGPRVLEILQFSGLFADVNSGTFSSEIRLARLYDHEKGTVQAIKGGSLSGAIVENFKRVRLCKDLVRHAYFSAGSPQGHGYFGPSHALLSEVSISGS